MPPTTRRILLVAAIAATLVTACGAQAVLEATDHPPAVVEAVDGASVRRVTLTEEAAHRIGIETAAVQAGGAGRVIVPTAAVLYDADGKTWVYTNPASDQFLRAQVDIVEIKGDSTVLSSGPPSDTLVVTVGVAELFGAETGVGEPE